jgi:hypothetical protein
MKEPRDRLLKSLVSINEKEEGMSTRGLYDRSGEVFAYLDGTRVYDLDSRQIGELRGQVIYDLDDERHWLVDGDALLDLRGNVIGYLGESTPHDEDW